jgi:hypothetical protein
MTESVLSEKQYDGCLFIACKQWNILCRTAGFNTFPDYLVLHMRKFVMEAGWVPKKLGNAPHFVCVSMHAADWKIGFKIHWTRFIEIF